MPGAPDLLLPQIEGRLLPRFFLDGGIRETPDWAALDDAAVDTFAERAGPLLDGIAASHAPNEAETESTLIFPLLDALGWHHLPQQAANARREDRPDALLFLDHAAREAARGAPLGSGARLSKARVVAENKAWGVALGTAGPASGGAAGRTPASQILRYLRLAEEASDGAVRWAMLTNGQAWRLYFAGAESRSERFLEADLPALLSIADPAARRDALRSFLLLWRPEAHRAAPDGGPDLQSFGFLDRAIAAGQRYQTRITAGLSTRVFDTVFPALVTAVAEGDPLAAPADPAWRREAGETAMVLLYRCLFVLYAEDRGLLPVGDPGYRPFSFRELREDAAKWADGTLAINPRGSVWWSRMGDLFRAIAGGSREMALPAYNGGLFDDSARPMLGRLRLRDLALAGLIENLSREGPPAARHWINYRDLSVQQLGAVYEGLLEREVAPDPGMPAGVTTRPNAYARKTTGSYYTPEDLVGLVIRRAVDPLLEERRAAFRERAAGLAEAAGTRAERLGALGRSDPAEAFLALRVLDPAMGSGHFLVSLVDHLADATLEAMEEAREGVGWGDYASPLAATLGRMRATIRARAAAGGWTVAESRLDDRSLVRRIILKRVVHGVDLNPMAVELAKLSLWLHSFTVGAPLSFLDHHLRCGDALFGEFVGPVMEELRGRYGLAVPPTVIAAASGAAAGMAAIEERDDGDLTQVAESKSFFGAMEAATADLRALLDLYHAHRWLPPGDPAAKEARDLLLGGSYGDPVDLAAVRAAPNPPRDAGAEIRRRGRVVTTAGAAHAAAVSFLGSAGAVRMERRFLHWEAAFPNLWRRWDSGAPEGGFDAVIGNPPWDRMKLQEVEWFAARVPAIAHQARAADRKRMIADLRRAGGEVAAAYDDAAWAAEAAARVAREGGAYPTLSGGDVNLYSLFVERGLRLLSPRGLMGVVVPSGIAADKGAAAFFQGVSTTGRLSALFDFENGSGVNGPFFPDVHRSFKFCVLAVGGTGRRFGTAALAFFGDDAAAAEAAAFALEPGDFRVLNPNTGTAPVFRTPRDAALTLAAHRRLPVLVRHGPPREAAYPVRYATNLHMTNDSARFRTATELGRDGAYRVAANRWKRGAEEFVPLYEGKMVQAFDHRAASVTVNTANLHRPAQPEAATLLQRADPSWVPTPQFWVGREDSGLPPGLEWAIGFKDVTAPTNVRTMIAAVVPVAGYGNTLPLLLPAPPPGPLLPSEEHHAIWRRSQHRTLRAYAAWGPLLLGNLNALAYDYFARQKVQGQHLNFYIVEQLPVVPRGAYGIRVGGTTARRLARDHVLRLSYTAHDLAPFARDQGHAGPPFRWDEEERLHLRARLDALYFLLYGLTREEAAHVLSTFPIVEREERERYAASHGGAFRTRDLVLGYMAAFAAGDAESRIAA